MDRGSIAGQTVRGEEGCAKGGEECSLPAGRVGDWLCAGRKDGVSWVVVRGAMLTSIWKALLSKWPNNES